MAQKCINKLKKVFVIEIVMTYCNYSLLINDANYNFHCTDKCKMVIIHCVSKITGPLKLFIIAVQKLL